MYAGTHTCVRIDGEEFWSSSLQLVGDVCIRADVSVWRGDLQDEPAGRGVLRDALAVQRLSNQPEKEVLMGITGNKGENPTLKRKYLFTLRAVVVGVQNLDLHSGFGSEDPVAGSDV